MSGWIKLDKTLVESLRFKRLAKELSRSVTRDVTRGVICDETIALGALARLWLYADTHIGDDNLLEATLDEIDEIVGIQGFAQLMPIDWLKVIDSHHVELPNFLGHNGTSARMRKQGAERQARYRHRKSGALQQRDVTQSNALRNASNDARPDQTRPDQTRPKVPTEPVTQSVTAPQEPGAVEKVFSHWQQVHRKPKARLDDKRREIIRKALKHYSEADLCQSISGYLNSPHHMGQNQNGTVYDSIELFLRDSKHVDDGLKFYAEPPRTDLSATTRRNVAAISTWKPPELRDVSG